MAVNTIMSQERIGFDSEFKHVFDEFETGGVALI
jgi:hypothetical protein